MRARVLIRPKHGILDPQGVAVERALPALGFSGCNLTIPHKVAALDIVDRVDPLAGRIGAVNTVIVAPDGSLDGQNTDAFGFIESVREDVLAFCGNMRPRDDMTMMLVAR